jgi:hypothetical protein
MDAAFSGYQEGSRDFHELLRYHGQLPVNWLNIPSDDTFNGMVLPSIFPRHT